MDFDPFEKEEPVPGWVELVVVIGAFLAMCGVLWVLFSALLS